MNWWCVVTSYHYPLPLPLPLLLPSVLARSSCNGRGRNIFEPLVLCTFTGFKIVNRFALLPSLCVFLQLSVERNLGGVLSLFLNFIVVYRAEPLTDLADQDGAKGYWNPS